MEHKEKPQHIIIRFILWPILAVMAIVAVIAVHVASGMLKCAEILAPGNQSEEDNEAT